MSKYRTYAQRLDEDFKQARDQYAKAFNDLEEAKREVFRSRVGTTGNEIEDALRKNSAQLSQERAQAAFDAAERTVWAEFNERRAALRRDLSNDIKRDNLANPDQVDMPTLELLKSGILTAKDMEALVIKFDTVPTMLRLIGKTARDMANSITDIDRKQEKAQLMYIDQITKDGNSSILRNWDDLSSIADHCSGQAGYRKATPDHIITMGQHWEDLSSNAIENF